MYRQSAVDDITLAFRPSGPHQYSPHVLGIHNTHMHMYVHTHIYVSMYRQSAVDAITLAFRPSGSHQYSAHVLL